MKVVSVAQMRAIEAAADAAGHSYAEMMERAGRGVAEALQERIPVKGKRVLVLVGPGNNGGDGLVAARYLAQAGADVACYLTRPRDASEDDNYRRLQELAVRCLAAQDDPQHQALRRMAASADVLIDALLGTGTALPIHGPIAGVLRAAGETLESRERAPASRVRIGGIPPVLRRQRPFVVAVDGPSGLDFDSGALDEAALRADLTVTFACPKQGHFRFPGAGALGELVVADIGTDPALVNGVALEVATAEMVRAWLPARPPDAHKGTFGKALIVAGSANYTGAARLAGAAAVRAGAGLVTLALPAAIHTAVAAALAEATYLLLPHELGVIAPAATELLAERAPEYNALLVGPGLGQERETVEFVRGLLVGEREPRTVGFVRGESTPPTPPALPPLVVDADGLNILAGTKDWAARLPPGTVLTPHPGEMARLCGLPTAEIQAERMDVARRYAQAWGHVVVLKGAYTVVAAPDGRTVIEPFANAGLATGGTGDVLAGVIVALRAQGLGGFEAAVCGAYLHGLAGELARRRKGAAGMAASDLLDGLAAAWRRIEGDDAWRYRQVDHPTNSGNGPGRKNQAVAAPFRSG